MTFCTVVSRIDRIIILYSFILSCNHLAFCQAWSLNEYVICYVMNVSWIFCVFCVKVFSSITIYSLLRFISWNLTTQCLAVTGGGRVGEYGR